MGLTATYQKPGRFYDENGDIVPGSDLRMARKLSLKPSVTSILGVLDKPALVTWKIEEALKRSLVIPMGPGETTEEWIKRVARAEDKTAANRGTEIHSFAEGVVKGSGAQGVPGFEIVCEKLALWIEENLGPGESEAKVIAPRYAGRTDWIGVLKDGRKAIVDFKTYGNKNGELDSPSFQPYLEYLAQLTAYGGGSGEYTYINVMISTNPEKPTVRAYEWGSEDIPRGWEYFLSALRIWEIQNNYGV